MSNSRPLLCSLLFQGLRLVDAAWAVYRLLLLLTHSCLITATLTAQYGQHLAAVASTQVQLTMSGSAARHVFNPLMNSLRAADEAAVYMVPEVCRGQHDSWCDTWRRVAHSAEVASVSSARLAKLPQQAAYAFLNMSP